MIEMNEHLDSGSGTGAANDRFWVVLAAKLQGRSRSNCGRCRFDYHSLSSP
ncbi:hypothetical protein U1839_20890 [Sphingomonas sp. RT2P30]